MVEMLYTSKLQSQAQSFNNIPSDTMYTSKVEAHVAIIATRITGMPRNPQNACSAANSKHHKDMDIHIQ